ncbi:MAG TPA: ABC transporter ATP-binding protein [Chloroflexota bacterium]|nr:ABC transporter ATP-binding protein [Chloroflexota bacterium]
MLEADKLTKHFRVGGMFDHHTLHAVDDVDLAIGEREIVALVGESGSGKSTVARLLARLYMPTSGEIRFRGRALVSFRSRRDTLDYRGHVQVVFQDPYSSLNPVYPASHGVFRSLKLHQSGLTRNRRRETVERILGAVGLYPASELIRKFPYELSGGQRQRFGFAQALASRPQLILADEPVSMLDVSIRIGVLNLMSQLREREGVSFLYITHDIASARYVADRMLVMYAAHVVETGPVEAILANPKHPYTQLLLSAVPDPLAPVEVEGGAAAGEPPRVINPAPGCRFRWRCPLATDECAQVTPRLRPIGPGRMVACHVAEPDATDG